MPQASASGRACYVSGSGSTPSWCRTDGGIGGGAVTVYRTEAAGSRWDGGRADRRAAISRVREPAADGTCPGRQAEESVAVGGQASVVVEPLRACR